MKKKGKKILKIIVIILLIAIAFLIGYFVTYYVDKAANALKKSNIEVLVDDTLLFELENTNVLEKSEALKEWPYIFRIKNNGNTNSLYKIKIKLDQENDIDINNLNYVLFVDNKEVDSDKLSTEFYVGNIKKNKEQELKLYIYKSKEDKGTKFKYSLDIEAILEGGPGF